MQRCYKLMRVDLGLENPGKVELKEAANLRVCKDSEYKR